MKPIVIALFLLMSISTSAFADSVWVLWLRNDTVTPSRSDTISGFPRNTLRYEGMTLDLGHKQCEKDRDALQAKVGNGRGLWAICLPENVDPREPKVKLPAPADNSWVLWTETSRGNGRNTEYAVQMGFANQAECERILVQSTEVPVEVPPGMRSERRGFTFRAFLKDGSVVDTRMFCLPHSIDPRAPKK